MKILLFLFLFFLIVSCETQMGVPDCVANKTGTLKFINNDTIILSIYIFDFDLMPFDTIIVDTSSNYSIDIPIGKYTLIGINPYDSILTVDNCRGYTYRFPILSNN